MSKDFNRQETVAFLKPLLISTFHLAFKTKVAHWNSQGPSFMMWHELFDRHHTVLSEAVDELAERLRILGDKIEPDLENWIKNSFLKASPHQQSYLEDLLTSHTLLVNYICTHWTEALDEGTKDIVIGRLKDHEKTIWILKSHVAS